MIVSLRIFYLILGDVGSYYYGPEHPMKPFRIKMAHQLILSYGLYRKMSVYVRISPFNYVSNLTEPLIKR